MLAKAVLPLAITCAFASGPACAQWPNPGWRRPVHFVYLAETAGRAPIAHVHPEARCFWVPRSRVGRSGRTTTRQVVRQCR